jgi:hypothetical protein
MRIGVISHFSKVTGRPERYVSKNAAAALVRRLLAVHISKGLIQMVEIRQSGLRARIQAAPHVPMTYQHHIEPKLERLTSANSEWMAYLEGVL